MATTPPALNTALQANDKAFDVIGLLSPSEFAAYLVDDGTAIVVIDIVRNTTTSTAVLAAGAERLLVRVKPETDDEVEPDVRRAGVGLVIAGEKHGQPVAGGLFGNSVLDVPADLTGMDVLFYSTNGGRAIDEAAGAAGTHPGARVYLAAMANLDLLAKVLSESPHNRLVLACGGFYSKVSIEDAVAGGRLLQKLGRTSSDLDDGAITMVALAQHLDNDEALLAAVRRNRIGRALAHYGREADIPAAITGAGVDEHMWTAMTNTVGELAFHDCIPSFIRHE